jgi:TonB family protein
VRCRGVLLALVLARGLSPAASAQENQPATIQQEGPGDEVTQQINLGPLIHTVKPDIPRKLRKRQLVAVLSATVSTEGTLQKVEVLGGDEDFTPLVLNVVEQWRYAPANLNGQPVDAKVFVIVESIKGQVDSHLELDTVPIQPANLLVGEEVLKVDPHTMKAPKALYSPDPQYSEEARVARYSGVGVLGVVVGRDGNPKTVWVSKKLGLGLDEKAIEAVRQWRFEPAMKNGQPVATAINVEVSFRLY